MAYALGIDCLYYFSMVSYNFFSIQVYNYLSLRAKNTKADFFAENKNIEIYPKSQI